MSSNDYNQRPIIVMDFETTGFDPVIHDIIEIGAVKVDHQLHTLGFYESKIKIQNFHSVQPEALDVNGYTITGWNNAPELASVIKDFVDFSFDGIFSAWNIGFEYRFLFEAFRRIGIKNPFLERRYSHCIDIPSIAWYAFHGNLTNIDYDTMARTLKIEPEPRPHRALNGAFHNLAVLRALRKRMP